MKETEHSGIPRFQSPEEEKEYWETRGPLAEGYKGKVNRPRHGQKRSSFLAVRLTGEELTRLHDVAEKQGMGPSTFARHVLTEAVEKRSNSPENKTPSDVIRALEENLSLDDRERFNAISGRSTRERSHFV